MAHPQVVDGGYVLHVCIVAANVLNEQLTDDKGWSSILGVEQGANNSTL